MQTRENSFLDECRREFGVTTLEPTAELLLRYAYSVGYQRGCADGSAAGYDRKTREVQVAVGVFSVAEEQ